MRKLTLTIEIGNAACANPPDVGELIRRAGVRLAKEPDAIFDEIGGRLFTIFDDNGNRVGEVLYEKEEE